MMCIICNYAFSDGIFINEQPEALASMRAQIFKMHHGDVGRIKSMIEHNKKKIISSRGVYHVDEVLIRFGFMMIRNTCIF